MRQVDAAAGGRRRSAVIVEALREYVRLHRLREALDRGAGLLADRDGPWGSDREVDRWVRALRGEWGRGPS